MNKKRLNWIIIGLICAGIMVGIDLFKIHKENKLPVINIVVNDTNLDVEAAPISWNGKKSKKNYKDLVKNQKPRKIEPFEKVNISFDRVPRHFKISVVDMATNQVVMETYDENKYELFNEPGKKAVVIEGEWGKGNVQYAFMVDINKKVSYQSMLANEIGGYSVLTVANKESNLVRDLVSLPVNISEVYEVDSVKNVNNAHPSLQVKNAPTFILFDHEKMIYKTKNYQDLIRYFHTLY